MIRSVRPLVVALAAMLALVTAACGDDDTATADQQAVPTASAEPSVGADSTSTPEPTPPDVPTSDSEPSPSEPAPTATPEPAVLHILVTNDDGVGAEGIDLVVEALQTLPDVEITVVAPAENQSGTSDTLSETPPEATDTTTISGYPAIAVAGTPGDSVRHALDVVFTDAPPDLIVSGSNDGQNVGPFAQASGTVGAARIGARAGIPAFAISQAALTIEPDFEAGIPFLLDWVTANRDEILAFDGPLGTVTSLNVASCSGVGEVRGLVEVPLAAEFSDGEPFEIDCTSTLDQPDDDATALVNGFAALTVIPEELVRGEG